jgi:hypothetical protein
MCNIAVHQREGVEFIGAFPLDFVVVDRGAARSLEARRVVLQRRGWHTPSARVVDIDGGSRRQVLRSDRPRSFCQTVF